MRVGRAVELSAWILGIALLGFHAAARLSFEHARVAGIEAFREASVSQPVSQSPAAVAEPAVPVDQSLWSEQRIAAFAASVANTGPPEGVLTIPSLQLEVPVYSGTSEINLNRGAGHIEGTAPLSDVGNVGIAAHRDGFFRKLEDIAIGDEVGLEVRGRTLRYRVVDISVVMPSDVHVIAPTEIPSVTLVTCYPFYFVGAAPQRYIVRAELSPAPAIRDAVAMVLQRDN
ncbi:MAG TPA: class D sortase [Gammaproteobacteria bacterium]|nr:class D sortase [Gammaproteobacteria bacterium]